jgi:RimJ/RimL family protein N-acetyltransferase
LDVGMDPVALEDERLLLRVPELADVPAVTAACQDPEVQRWTTVPSPYTEKDARWFVEDYARPRWAGDVGATWLITDRSSGELLGCYGLDLAAGVGEVGFWVAAPARGRGVCTAATRLVCRWGFDTLGLRRIEWQAFVGNVGSRRVAEKAGFVIEGTCRARLVQRGEPRDGWLGGLLPGDVG